MASKNFVNNPFFSEVENLAFLALESLFKNKAMPVDFLLIDNLISQITRPPESQMGHAAMPCHSLSKIFRLPPQKIAELLKDQILPKKSGLVKEVQTVAGYLNFFTEISILGQQVFPKIVTGEFFKGQFFKESEKEKIIIEYSQPNTHKALHVGHLRNVVYGDAVCGLLEYIGHDVIRATYPGDMGAHIAKTLWFISKFRKDQIDKGTADWLGEIYSDASEAYKKAEGSPQETDYRNEISEVLKQLQAQKGPFYDLYLKTREWSLSQMKDLYKWLGSHFDLWFYESECDAPSRELVIKKFKEGFLKESEGAIGLDLSSYGLGFALFLKSDGNGLYLTKDLELIRRKFEDPSITRSIVIVDSRQKLHFQQLFKTAELMGYPQAAKSVHLAYENVLTEEGTAFSSRSKNGVGITELRQKIETLIQDQFLVRYRGVWSESEIRKTAEIIGLGALKYGMLKVDSSNTIRFVLSEWLKLEGETGPYIQYAFARANSLLAKVVENSDTSLKNGLLENFQVEHPVESELVLHLSCFNKAAYQAAVEYRPSVLTAYIYDLCKLFNHFYKECPLKGAASNSLQQSRLFMTQAVKRTLAEGFRILNIPLPEKM
jgi:arginyl-tRNA synthetase